MKKFSRYLPALVLISLTMSLPLFTISSSAATISSPYVLAGGETGTWFTPSQNPIFYQISVTNGSEYSDLTSNLVEGTGTVWTGGWNGSQWLVTGFGVAANNQGFGGPAMFLFDQNMDPISYNTTEINSEMTSWSGGDVFSASWGGNDNWLVSGLGSGDICGGNHMSLGLFNGSNFIDLSSRLPCDDYILYASAWNGQYWLVGGGYLDGGAVLYSYTPANNTLNTLSSIFSKALGSDFHPVTSIAWNGKYWLIGGMGFLAELNSGKVTNLTKKLNSAASNILEYPNSVNSIVWDSSSSTWYFGGGLPISVTPSLAGSSEQAWLASYSTSGKGSFKDLTSHAIPSDKLSSSNSAVLSLSLSGTTLIAGGYYTPSSTNQGVLLFYNTSAKTTGDESTTVSSFGYVDWVGTE